MARFARFAPSLPIGWILPIARLAKAVRVTDCERPIAYRLLSKLLSLVNLHLLGVYMVHHVFPTYTLYIIHTYTRISVA